MTTLTTMRYDLSEEHFGKLNEILNRGNSKSIKIDQVYLEDKEANRQNTFRECEECNNEYLARAQQVEPQPVELQVEPVVVIQEPQRRQAEVLQPPPERYICTDRLGRSWVGLYIRVAIRDEYGIMKIHHEYRDDIGRKLAHWNGTDFIKSPLSSSRVRRAKKKVDLARAAVAAQNGWPLAAAAR